MPSNLVDLLGGLASGVFTVPVVSWVLNNWLDQATTNQKKITAYAVSFLLGTTAFFALGYLRTEPVDLDPQALLNSLWPVWFAAFTASQAALMTAKKVGVVR